METGKKKPLKRRNLEKNLISTFIRTWRVIKKKRKRDQSQETLYIEQNGQSGEVRNKI